MKALKTLLIGIILVSFMGCDEILDALVDNTALLTDRVWVFDSVSGFDATTNDFFSALLTGSTWNFDEDGTYTTGSALGGTGGGDWSFSSDETALIVDGETWTIVDLTTDRLEFTLYDADAINDVATLILKH